MKLPRLRTRATLRTFPGPRRRTRRPTFDRLESRALLSMTMTVNTVADENDPTDGTLSLREAIELSNGQIALASLSAVEQAQVFISPSPPSAPGSPIPNVVLFNLPTGAGGIQTIQLAGSPLPAITTPLEISGYSQPGSSVSPPDKTEVVVNDARVQIDGSALGPGVPGVGYDGIAIATSNCEVNGLIVTGFSGFGISISGAGSQGNWLWGNFLGTLPDPTSGRFFSYLPSVHPTYSNQRGGIAITSSNNRVGGNTPGLPNVIANNGFDAAGSYAGGVGLLIDTPGGTGNLIQGNAIFNNAAQGIFVRSSNNTIGEAHAGGGNSIAGNGADGVLITGGPTVQGNGLLGNFLGTALGTIDGKITKGSIGYPNGGNGVLILDSPKNYLGGASTAARNILGTNLLDGVTITGAAATGNRLLNNWIGFNITNGLEWFLPNRNGVSIFSPSNEIGDAVGGVGNTIDNNRNDGILLTGALASGNTIAANVIGLNPGGGSAFPNAFDGVHLDDAPNNVIGGTTVSARNTISSNNNGVYVFGTGSTGNLILGNFIGTAVDGLTDLGNAVDGVVLDNAPNNTVGGTVPGAGNVISGNNRGVRITGASATRNDVQGNFIGTDLAAVANIHNEIDGVFVTLGASNNLIGGGVAGAGNSIVFNAGAGVLLDGGTANSVLNNSIFTNTGHGIVLNALTGANLLQPAPDLSAVIPNGSSTNVQGTLVAAANTDYAVQFFSSAAKDPSGFGQGQTYLFTTTVTTDVNGVALIDFDVPVAVASGRFVTTTATDPAGNTSAFSNALIAVPVGVQLGAASYTVNENGGAAVISVTRTGGQGGSVSVDYTVGGGTAVAGVDYTTVSGTIFFNPGDPVTKTFVVPILDPHKVGGSVTVNVTLANPTNGATIGIPSAAVVTILDNDQATVQFASAPGTFNGSGVAKFTVVRDSGVGTLTVDYATANGSAVAGVNYVSAAGTLTFQPGETSKTISVTVLDDFQVHAAPLTFSVTLSHATGGLLGPLNSVVETVIPTNVPGTLQLPSYATTAAAGASAVTLTVYRTKGKTGQVTVDYATGGGTAKPGVDYTPVSGTLTFRPGEYTRTITVPLKNTATPGPKVTFDVTLSHATGGAKVGKPEFTTVTELHPAVPVVPPNPADRLPPTVVGVQAVSGPQGIYAVVLTFSKAMDPSRAQNATNYAFFVTSPSGTTDLSVGVVAAAYDPASRRVILFLGAPVPRGGSGRLVALAATPSAPSRGLTDRLGNALDGTGTGKAPGTPFVTVVR